MAPANSRIAGVLFLVASAQFLFGLAVAEALYPNYSLANNYISDLGRGPSAMIFNSSAFLFGLLAFVGAWFLPRTLNYRGLTILLILMSVGAMGVGIFTSAFTTIHGIVALMAFGFGGLSAIVSFKVSKLPMSAISVILGLTTLTALSLFSLGLVTTGSLATSVPPQSEFFLGIGPGGMERIMVYPAIIWFTLFSGYLMTLSPKQNSSSKQ